MKLDKFSVKWQIVGWFSVVVLVMISISALFSLLFSADLYRETKLQSTDEYMDGLAESISGRSFSADCLNSNAWCDGIRAFCEDSYNSVVIVNLDSNEYFEQNNLPHHSELDNQQFCANLVRSAEENGGEFMLSDSRGAFGTIYFARIVQALDGKVAVMMNTSVRPTDPYIDTFRRIFILSCISSIIISIILVYIISRRIARPITSITKASQGVAEGKFIFENGKSTGYKEISQLNQSLSVAAKEISKTESLQKELIANISHDLRTPLTIISGYAEMMKDFKDADHTESIDGILNETRRMSELVNDILDLSQIKSGAMYHDEVMNLTACVREAIARFSSLESQGYFVHFDAEKDVFIKADEKRVMQVAYNLISNAINYCGADKAVYVSQVVENNQVKISVRDNGEGIPPESINDIWQRYYKVDKEHKRAGKGTGLGLTIVKGILENYSSDYGVESKPGVGSTFWFTFNIENL